MTDALTYFPPSLDAAQNRLGAFVPKAGKLYAQRRNFDFGAGGHDHVSSLSPYLRLRMLDELTVTRAVLAQHSRMDADKFIAEVFWRTYWKGWMEQRPAVWDSYRQELATLQDAVQTQSGLRAAWEDACLGRTGIAAFDTWAQELVETGYLHNHARMWFASIWMYTLKLPWALGADFFLRHLLDGDAAVNTLSWRWVAGIQTKGKTYLARPDNIAKFTHGRFPQVTGLAPFAPPLEAPPPPDPQPLPPCHPQPLAKRYGILVHCDDLDVSRLLAFAGNPDAAAFADATAGHSPWQMAPHVGAFRQASARALLPEGADKQTLLTAQDIGDWAARHGLEQIVTPYASVGPMAQMLRDYSAIAGAPALNMIRRPLDSAAWPHATKGFFPFRKKIPDLLDYFLRAD